MVAAIEAPLTLLQKPVKIIRRQAVEATQMSRGLVPKVLNAIDLMPSLRDEDLTVVHAPMVKLRDIQHIVRSEAIRIDNTVWGHLLANDGQQRSRLGIRNNRRKYLPPRVNKPNTGTLPAAARPRLPLRTPPK